MREAIVVGVLIVISAFVVSCGASGESGDGSGADSGDVFIVHLPPDAGHTDVGTQPSHDAAPMTDAVSTAHDATSMLGDDASQPPADTGSGNPPPSDGGSTTPMTGLHVVNGKIVNSAGQVVILHGVDRSGTEYMCSDSGSTQIFDGPNDQTSINAMLAWHINAVRVPLNEDCWLGINGVNGPVGGANYQNAIQTYVNLLVSNGIAAILDLHWNAPGSELATSFGQEPLPDADHSPAFWTSVATMFANNGSVIFDLFNEPYINGNSSGATSDWNCWLQPGTSCVHDQGPSGATYATPGMATLLKAVRDAGAQNVVILGGLSSAQDFTNWLSSVQSIPSLPAPLNGISIENVGASWHMYDFNSTYSECPTQYNGYAGQCASGQQTAQNSHITDIISAGFPVIIGESGISAWDSGSAAPFSAAQITDLENWYTSVLTWMEQQGQGYLAWTWNPPPNVPSVITDYSGTPTQYFGQTYQSHLLATF